jgi:hypothetical protein
VEALQAALSLRRSIDDRLGVASARAELGQIAIQQGQYAEARAHLAAALQTASANQATALLLRALTWTAALLTGMGRPARAIELLACVLQQPGAETRTRDWASRALADAARRLPELAVAGAQARGRQLEPTALTAAALAELKSLDDAAPV